MENEKRLIYVEDVLSKIDREMELCNSGLIRGELKFLKGLVGTIPTVDAVEVVHGRWEQLTLGAICRCCNNWNNRSSNYCPNCGAKMDGEPT
jgi:hypothetical protein